MAVRIDKTEQTVHELSLIVSESEDQTRTLEESWKRRISAVEEFRARRQFLVEVILVRHIENFLSYLSGLLYEIFTQRPETLRSSDRIALEQVLRHDSIEALVRDVAEQRVESLSYSSFADLCEFFAERFKLAVASGQDLAKLISAIEIRNISVHNRCIVSRRFAKRTGASESSVGTKKVLYGADVADLIPLLANRVRVLDAEARRRLRLKGSRFASRSTNSQSRPAQEPMDAQQPPAFAW